MNLILLEEKDFSGPDHVRITGQRFIHVKKVIKPGNNSILTCGMVNGKMGTGTLLSMDRQGFEMKVNLVDDPPPPLPLTLVMALPRPKMLKRILQSLASLGVKDIYLINSWRVEKSFWKSDVLDSDRLERHLRLGLAQAKDTQMPRVHLRRYFTPFVQEEIESISRGKVLVLAHPKSVQPCPVGVNKQTVLVIGPEGGFIEKEISAFVRMGFESFTLGPRILRVETAVTALVSRLFT
ncbi:MAG: 16S rRNA (uracil(1498)-N(3))-methyltransferase [Desulfobacter sp.]|nr:16S rRNA (uracil(1498)-N(3))-methyltransferase [Desulfobacter sp.]WDP86394.1 MAG: 16S rRNA (uracil(1498)-N(3))-methyltransferase [Desulfobacter sp.]